MKKFKKLSATIFVHGWLIISAAVVLIPLLWMICAALTPGKLLSSVPLFPKLSDLSLENYHTIFTYRLNPNSALPDFVAAFGRTFVMAVINTIGVILVSTISGIAFARFRFKGRKPLLLTMMAFQMFPSFMAMIALMLLFRTFGLLNNPYAITLIYITGSIPYNIFLIKGYLSNVPKSLDEAAAIDGATNLQIITKILLPLSTPIIGFIAIGAFMAPWLDFILQSMFLQQEKMTVAMWLYRTTDPTNTMFYNPLVFMAGALLIAIPIMAIQFYMQRFVVGGLTAGADKG